MSIKRGRSYFTSLHITFIAIDDKKAIPKLKYMTRVIHCTMIYKALVFKVSIDNVYRFMKYAIISRFIMHLNDIKLEKVQCKMNKLTLSRCAQNSIFKRL